MLITLSPQAASVNRNLVLSMNENYGLGNEALLPTSLSALAWVRDGCKRLDRQDVVVEIWQQLLRTESPKGHFDSCTTPIQRSFYDSISPM
jgi:hypothetical protein